MGQDRVVFIHVAIIPWVRALKVLVWRSDGVPSFPDIWSEPNPGPLGVPAGGLFGASFGLQFLEERLGVGIALAGAARIPALGFGKVGRDPEASLVAEA